MKSRTIDLIGLRTIYDSSGPEIALKLLNNIPEQTILQHDPGEWGDIFDTSGKIINIASEGGRFGHVRIATIITSGMKTCGNLIFVAPGTPESQSLNASQTIVTGSVSRPITVLIDHPYLDDDMIIQGLNISPRVESWISVKKTSIRIKDAIKIVENGKPL